MPCFWLIICHAVANQTVSGVRVLWKIVPAVADTRRWQSGHHHRPPAIRHLRRSPVQHVRHQPHRHRCHLDRLRPQRFRPALPAKHLPLQLPHLLQYHRVPLVRRPNRPVRLYRPTEFFRNLVHDSRNPQGFLGRRPAHRRHLRASLHPPPVPILTTHRERRDVHPDNKIRPNAPTCRVRAGRGIPCTSARIPDAPRESVAASTAAARHLTSVQAGSAAAASSTEKRPHRSYGFLVASAGPLTLPNRRRQTGNTNLPAGRYCL